MSDQSEFSDGSGGSPFLDALSAFEAGVDKYEAVPDAVFAEPSFGRDQAQFGLLVGRNKVIEFRAGPEGLQARIGRFTGNRRRPISTAGVAKALGKPVSETERMVTHIEQALRSGIAAYQDTYRRLVIEAYRTENPVTMTPQQDQHQERIEQAPVIEHAPGNEQQQALKHRLNEDPRVRPARPRRSGTHRPTAPFPTERPGRDAPGRSSGLSL